MRKCRAREGKAKATLSMTAWACILLLAFLMLFQFGCGLETEKANQKIQKAAEYQSQAQEILKRLEQLPVDWEIIFNAPLGTDQINRGRQIIADRTADVDALEIALTEWNNVLKEISLLNVEDKVKEYVKLKRDFLNCYLEYITASMRPIVSAYSNLVEMMAQGRPRAELDQAAMEIANMVRESREQLKTCEELNKKADEYFEKNEVGS